MDPRASPSRCFRSARAPLSGSGVDGSWRQSDLFRWPHASPRGPRRASNNNHTIRSPLRSSSGSRPAGPPRGFSPSVGRGRLHPTKRLNRLLGCGERAGAGRAGADRGVVHGAGGLAESGAVDGLAPGASSSRYPRRMGEPMARARRASPRVEPQPLPVCPERLAASTCGLQGWSMTASIGLTPRPGSRGSGAWQPRYVLRES